MGLVSFYALYRIQATVEPLAQKTVPGVRIAGELIQLASKCENLRLGCGTVLRTNELISCRQLVEESLVALLARSKDYEATIRVQDDRANYEALQTSLQDYAQSLRLASAKEFLPDPILTRQYEMVFQSLDRLYDFRVARAINFVGESSRDSALAIRLNIVLLTVMVAGLALLAIFFKWKSARDVLPDDF